MTKTTINGRVQIPVGYRIVPRDEQIQQGDLFTTPARDTWDETKATPGSFQNPLSPKVYIRKTN